MPDKGGVTRHALPLEQWIRFPRPSMVRLVRDEGGAFALESKPLAGRVIRRSKGRGFDKKPDES